MAENEDAAAMTEVMDEEVAVIEATEIDDEREVVDTPAQHSNRNRGRERDNDGGGGFKEPPFTFLAPDDPILLSCL